MSTTRLSDFPSGDFSTADLSITTGPVTSITMRIRPGAVNPCRKDLTRPTGVSPGGLGSSSSTAGRSISTRFGLREGRDLRLDRPLDADDEACARGLSGRRRLLVRRLRRTDGPVGGRLLRERLHRRKCGQDCSQERHPANAGTRSPADYHALDPRLTRHKWRDSRRNTLGTWHFPGHPSRSIHDPVNVKYLLMLEGGVGHGGGCGKAVARLPRDVGVRPCGSDTTAPQEIGDPASLAP